MARWSERWGQEEHCPLEWLPTRGVPRCHHHPGLATFGIARRWLEEMPCPEVIHPAVVVFVLTCVSASQSILLVTPWGLGHTNKFRGPQRG